MPPEIFLSLHRLKNLTIVPVYASVCDRSLIIEDYSGQSTVCARFQACLSSWHPDSRTWVTGAGGHFFTISFTSLPLPPIPLLQLSASANWGDSVIASQARKCLPSGLWQHPRHNCHSCIHAYTSVLMYIHQYLIRIFNLISGKNAMPHWKKTYCPAQRNPSLPSKKYIANSKGTTDPMIEFSLSKKPNGSYHKFKHKSWSNFFFIISTKH